MMIEQTKSNFDLKWFLFSLEGRINRLPFWIFNFAIFWIALFLGIASSRKPPEVAENIQLIAALILFWPSLSVQAKRWHDTNRSAWWILINLVPIIGPLWAIVIAGFSPGTVGENRFGKDPLEGIDKSSILSNRSLTGKEMIWGFGLLFIFIFLLVVLAKYLRNVS